jgi:hypothetical protein
MAGRRKQKHRHEELSKMHGHVYHGDDVVDGVAASAA